MEGFVNLWTNEMAQKIQALVNPEYTNPRAHNVGRRKPINASHPLTSVHTACHTHINTYRHTDTQQRYKLQLIVKLPQLRLSWEESFNWEVCLNQLGLWACLGMSVLIIETGGLNTLWVAPLPQQGFLYYISLEKIGWEQPRRLHSPLSALSSSDYVTSCFEFLPWFPPQWRAVTWNYKLNKWFLSQVACWWEYFSIATERT